MKFFRVFARYVALLKWMKIVVVQDYLRCGGTEMQSISLAAGFRSHGWDARLLTLRPGGPLLDRARKLGLDPIVLQPFDFKLNWVHPGLASELRKIAPDCVLLMGRNGNSLGGKILECIPDTKVFGTFRTGRKLTHAYVGTLQSCHHVFTNSHWGAGRLSDISGIHSDKVTVIPNGVVHAADPSQHDARRTSVREQLGTTPEKLVFLKVAAFRPGKDHAGLLTLFKDLGGDWELWLAGEGPERKACEQLADKLEYSGRVRFLGEQQEVVNLYHGADVAVLNSREESLPNFLVEAQVAGLPVVARDCAGVAEAFLPGKTGHLVDLEDTRGFLDALQDLADKPHVRQQMGMEARSWAQRQFCPSERLTDYIQKIQSLVGKS